MIRSLANKMAKSIAIWRIKWRSQTRQPRRKLAVETCVHNTAKLRSQASFLALRAAGANQLLKPASNAPRSYGRRHRSWHYGHVHATHNERRRGKRPVHHDQVLSQSILELFLDNNYSYRPKITLKWTATQTPKILTIML